MFKAGSSDLAPGTIVFVITVTKWVCWVISLTHTGSMTEQTKRIPKDRTFVGNFRGESRGHESLRSDAHCADTIRCVPLPRAIQKAVDQVEKAKEGAVKLAGWLSPLFAFLYNCFLRIISLLEGSLYDAAIHCRIPSSSWGHEIANNVELSAPFFLADHESQGTTTGDKNRRTLSKVGGNGPPVNKLTLVFGFMRPEVVYSSKGDAWKTLHAARNLRVVYVGVCRILKVGLRRDGFSLPFRNVEKISICREDMEWVNYRDCSGFSIERFSL